MANTPILDMVQVATNQNQKEATINTALAILEAACNDMDVFTMGSNRLLTKAQFTRAFHIRLTTATVPRVLTVPATPRFFAVSNEGSAAITVITDATVPGTTVVVEPGIRALLVSDGTNIYAITSGMGTSGGFGAFVGMDDASAGQVLKYDGAAWGPADLVAEHDVFLFGLNPANRTVYRKVITQDQRLFADFSGSAGSAGALATAATVYTVKKNGVTIGTVTFGAGSATPTFSTDVGAGSVSVLFAPGNVLSIEAPASADATLFDIAFTLKGVFL